MRSHTGKTVERTTPEFSGFIHLSLKRDHIKIEVLVISDATDGLSTFWHQAASCINNYIIIATILHVLYFFIKLQFSDWTRVSIGATYLINKARQEKTTTP